MEGIVKSCPLGPVCRCGECGGQHCAACRDGIAHERCGVDCAACCIAWSDDQRLYIREESDACDDCHRRDEHEPWCASDQGLTVYRTADLPQVVAYLVRNWDAFSADQRAAIVERLAGMSDLPTAAS